MAKRFTDTDKYKKPFIRGLKGAYKLLWDYIYHDCNHAGIWIKDFEIAQIYLGSDMSVNEEEALKVFNGKIDVLENGAKWFIPSFIEFQYGELNPENRAHNSVIQILTQYGLNKALKRGLKGRKDKDKDKDKDKSKDKESRFESFWKEYPKKAGKGKARESFIKLKPSEELTDTIIKAIQTQCQSEQWLKDKGQFIPHPATWLNQGRWEDEVTLLEPEPARRLGAVDLD